MSDYETTVRRVERAVGRQMKDYEVIVFLAEEAEQLREKVKKCSTATAADAEFAGFRMEVFQGLLGIYEVMDKNEQRAFDMGEVYGRLKLLEESLNNAKK